MTQYGPPETVYVEHDWWDGPRAGIGDVNGVPHRYVSIFDEEKDDYLDTFLIWPIDRQELELEIEQWRLFVEWITLFESGRADVNSHPSVGGRNARWDELEAVLKPSRDVPADARRAVAQLCRIDREARYTASGPAYMLSWSVL